MDPSMYSDPRFLEFLEQRILFTHGVHLKLNSTLPPALLAQELFQRPVAVDPSTLCDPQINSVPLPLYPNSEFPSITGSPPLQYFPLASSGIEAPSPSIPNGASGFMDNNTIADLQAMERSMMLRGPELEPSTHVATMCHPTDHTRSQERSTNTSGLESQEESRDGSNSPRPPVATNAHPRTTPDFEWCEQDRPFACGVCVWRFQRKRDRDRHERSVHTRESRYWCAACKKGFVRTDARQRHWKKSPECQEQHNILEPPKPRDSRPPGGRAKGRTVG